jgi:CRP-like cAMP-binding protein
LALNLEGVREDEVEEYGPGEILFTQGESADCMYLVLEGEVNLSVGGQALATVGEGDVLGEMALVDRAPRSALAECVGDVRLLPLDRDRFEQLIQARPEFARTVLRTMARRLRQMNLLAGGVHQPTGMSDSTSRLLLAMKGQSYFAPGAAIFKEGDRGEHMYFVASGTVDLRVGGKTVALVETGAFFGEMALLEDAPRSATAIAATECRLMPVDREKLDYLISRTPNFVVEMMRVIAGRLRDMNRNR